MMGAASTSETSVNFYQTTRRNNPEDSDLHTISFQITNSTKKTQRVSITNNSQLMLFREVISVFSENHKKPVHTVREQSSKLLNIKAGSIYTPLCSKRVRLWTALVWNSVSIRACLRAVPFQCYADRMFSNSPNDEHNRDLEVTSVAFSGNIVR
jgi:hypothetical protein